MAERDDFSPAIKRELAHRVGVKCSNPDCRRPTSGPSDEGNLKHINVGVASHIYAASKGGPRYDESMTPEERASFDNGIWLCQDHAKMVDDDEVRFTKMLLHVWKKAAEEIAFAEVSASAPLNTSIDDRELIKFYLQCFDRPAFQHPIEQEGRMDDFRKAIDDTVIALNTGVQRTRDGEILKIAEGKSMVTNRMWREKLETIVDMLTSINHRLSVAEADGVFHSSSYGNYCFNDKDIADWFDSTRLEILKLLSSICKEAGLIDHLQFPRPRRRW